MRRRSFQLERDGQGSPSKVRCGAGQSKVIRLQNTAIALEAAVPHKAHNTMVAKSCSPAEAEGGLSG